MIHLPVAWFAILTAPEPAPRPDPVPADAWRDLPPLDVEPMRFLIADDPPPALPEAPYTAPPNRAQRRAKRRAHR
jgi:hypothetical protein